MTVPTDPRLTPLTEAEVSAVTGERRARALWLRTVDGLTYRAVGDQLGVTGARASQLIESAASRLRRSYPPPSDRTPLAVWKRNLFERAGLTSTALAEALYGKGGRDL